MSLGPISPSSSSHPLLSWPPAPRDVLGGAGKPDQRLTAPAVPQSRQVLACAPSGQTRWQRPRLCGAAGRSRRAARGFRGAASPIPMRPPLSPTVPTPALALVTVTGGEADPKCSPGPSLAFRVQGVAGLHLMARRGRGWAHCAPPARTLGEAPCSGRGSQVRTVKPAQGCNRKLHVGARGRLFRNLHPEPRLDERAGTWASSLRLLGGRRRHCILDPGGRRKLGWFLAWPESDPGVEWGRQVRCRAQARSGPGVFCPCDPRAGRSLPVSGPGVGGRRSGGSPAQKIPCGPLHICTGSFFPSLHKW
ncbi:uncharacterized protein LOC117092484 [Trachypithecus francoisi]|uniref:uncharacterized protein LOC117092484 n=1 Tax=Trachypithecus francoisi TaxID=54180 RepID=UPI00141BBA6D|nr:uncharacterized protein LOC117092484 [Trachypithecus francoisi]